MWWHVYLAVFIPAAVLALNGIDIKFTIDYFSYRNVKMICLLQNEDFWLHNFSKQAARRNIFVSAIKIDKDFDERLKLAKCLQNQVYPSIGVVITTESDVFRPVMQYVSQNLLLDATHKWLILHGRNENTENNNTANVLKPGKINNTNAFQVFKGLNISVDADIVMATKSASNKYQLHEIVNFGKIQGGDCIIKRSGKWEHNKKANTSRLTTNLNEFKYYRRWNFNGLPLRTIGVVFPAPKNFDTKMFFDVSPSTGVATITRTGFTILGVIFEIHNLRFVHSLADRWVGDTSFNQSKNVVTTALYYKQQDLTPVLRFLSDTIDQYDILNPPVSSIETRYYYRIPTYGAGKFENQFLRPLGTQAWLCVLAMAVLCAAVLLVSAKLERRPSAGQYAIFSVVASLCQQFFDDISGGTNSSSARKIAIFVTGLSCVLIYNYYTSSVVSWLLNGPPPSINSLQELLEGPLDLIFEDIGYTRSWLMLPTYYYNKRNQKIEDELRKKKVFNKNKNAPLLVPLEEGIEMVKAGGYAYHTEVDSANRLISKTFDQSELCELGSLKSMEKTLLYSSVQKNSPYKEFLNWSLLRLHERGIIRCIQLRTWSTAMQCQGSSPRALALGGAAPAFLLLAAGYLLAIGITVVERIVWKYKQEGALKGKSWLRSKGLHH